MPRTGGIYSLPPGYVAVSGETIQPSQHNPPLEDIAQALTDSLPRNGTAPMTGNLPMGGNRITGLGAATDGGHAPRFDQVLARDGSYGMTAPLSVTAGTEAAPAVQFSNANNGVYWSPGNGPSFTAAGNTIGQLRGGTALSDTFSIVTRQAGDARYMQQSWTLTAGNGLTGGGNGSANRAVALGTPSTVGASTTNTVTTGSHTHAIGADIARSAITISSGNGLTGGGNLTANRTINMGTPSSITADSTNSASGNTHTHAISAATIGELMSRLSVGAVGTYALLADVNTSADLNPGATRAGSNLRYASAGGQTFGSAPAGTWQLCGFTPGGASSHEQRATVWMRVS
ncbi:hypothetical protein HYQ43_04680 [Paracoccus pantotrophus]|uniref:Tail fiber protein n=1 Tax=Paracoccus pantotrophus TaxID=82367 RepID=A0A7H9BS82_PARPN|nr:hypothetical protein [Paracoccus pantotrophus]QLH13578.1 hypothetical protein HYQ43_04680 [Paracoccus pantotrophus]